MHGGVEGHVLHGLAAIHDPWAQAMRRWGPNRCGAVLGCRDDRASIDAGYQGLVACGGRGPVLVVPGAPAGGDAVVVALDLLDADMLDAVLVLGIEDREPESMRGRPFSLVQEPVGRGHGGVGLIFERGAQACVAVHRCRGLDAISNLDWVLCGALGSVADATYAARLRHLRRPVVSVAGVTGDLGAAALAGMVEHAAQAIDTGMIPATTRAEPVDTTLGLEIGQKEDTFETDRVLICQLLGKGNLVALVMDAREP